MCFNGNAPARTAIIYDFDGTLADGNCAEHGLLQTLHFSDPSNFWKQVKETIKDIDGDEVLCYLNLLVEHSRAQKTDALAPERLRAFGAKIPLFPGVETWFDRINAFGSKRGLAVEHYIISSGIKEMILGTSIAHYFTHVFGCTFSETRDKNHAPSVAINYTTKTQFLFRINKGISNAYDNNQINRWVPERERPMPFERIIYIGDGDTDIPAMKMVMHKGGRSIAVFDEQKWIRPEKKDDIARLIAEERVNYVAPANYSPGELLDIVVKGVLGKIARDSGYRGSPAAMSS